MWLGDFSGNSMTELTAEHVMVLQRQLISEVRRYNEVLDQERLTLGRELSFREAKRISTETAIFGPTGVRTIVSAFNLAARLLEDTDGLAVSVRLRQPKGSDLAPTRGIGSADPNKVLTPHQIATLEKALGRELLRYDNARNRFARELSTADFKNGVYPRRSPQLDLERYFGINGFREHSMPEIARLNGLSKNSDGNIAYRIRRFLAKEIGADRAAEIIKLRGQFHYLMSKKKFAKVEASREYILSLLPPQLRDERRSRGIFIQQYFGLTGFRIHSLPKIACNGSLPNAKTANYHIREGLVCLVGAIKARRLLALRERLRHYLTRAIKAQALRLQLCVARRISALVKLPSKPATKVHVTEGRRIVEINFHAGKTWGHEGLSEWIPCVDSFGEIAQDAIRVAQRLTSDLRKVADGDIKNLLFILPRNSFDSATVLTDKFLQRYIYCGKENQNRGVLHRYNLESLSNFSFHHARHTHSTHMIEAGGTIQDVARYLGHNTFAGSTTMAGTFYLAGGTDAMREVTADALRKGAATGQIFDAVARLKIEAIGPAAKGVRVPPNQLSFQEARERLLYADVIEDIPIEPSEAAKLIEQKTVFNVTRYGGCLLQATSGPCPTANPCPIGIQPRGVEPQPGCGCKYLVLLPHSIEQLGADISIMEAQLIEMGGENWAGWRSHIQGKLDHYRSLLEIAMSLNESSEKTN